MQSIQQFGEFELDPQRFELRRGGERVQLQPKVLRLLLHLVAHRDRSVSTPELLATLWPGQAVTPASVRRAIAGARRALGERGDSQSSIQTVRDHGYRFLLPVRELAREADPRAVAEHSPPAAARAHEEPAFVGRESVLAMLEDSLTDALAARGRSLWIRGEPGVGKTRVLLELQHRARARGALAWVGRCREVEGAPPLWPVVQLLRAAAAQLGRERLCDAMGTGAADIAQAVPDVRTWLPHLPDAPPIDAPHARFRCFDSLAQCLARIARQQPLVLLLDDVQRADLATLRLLAFVCEHLAQERVLVAATLRAGHAAPEARADLLRALAGHPSARVVELSGLEPAELARYVELRAGAVAPAAVLARLHEQTGGNPLFLEQLLSCHPRPGGNGGWLLLTAAPIAAGLHGAIERHLEGLEPACRRLLAAAAVLGHDFAAGVLARMLEQSVESVVQQLQAAETSGVLAALPEPIGHYRFGHALIRDALYDQLAPDERARLHGQAGRALEALGSGGATAELPQLAEHFVLAAPAHDAGRAVAYVLASARAALQQLAYDEAAAQFERALGLLALGDAAAERRLPVLLDRSEALLCVPDARAARETLFEAGRLAERVGDADAMLRAIRLLGRLPESGSVDPDRVQLVERGLGMLPPQDERRACVQAALAKALLYSRERQAVTSLAQQAIHGAARLDDAPRAEVLATCLHALSRPEHLPERMEALAELERIGHEHGDPRILLAAAAARVWTSVERGDMAAADGAIDAVELIATRARDPLGRWHAKIFRAMRAIVASELDLASRLSREAFELGTRLGEVVARHVYCTQQSGVLRIRGQLTDAVVLVREVSLQHPSIAGWQAALASLEADLGRPDHARVVLDRLLARDLESLLRDPYTLGVLAPAADLCAQVGDASQARALYTALVPYADRHGVISIGVNTHGPLGRHLGRLAQQLGDADAAERHFARALESAERMRSPLFVSLTAAQLAAMLAQAGRPDGRERAGKLLGRAWGLAEKTQMTGLAAYCQSLAKGHGLAARRLELVL